MPVENYPLITGALPERRLSDFVQFLPELEAAIENGQIANARYVKSREALSRIIETVWVETVRKPYSSNREYIQAASEQEQDILSDLSNAPQTNTIARILRVTATLPDTEAGDTIRAITAELEAVLNLIKDAKSIAVKRTAAPAAPSMREIYQAPAASGSAVAQVLEELTSITAQARDSLIGSLSSRHEGMLSTFLKAADSKLMEAGDNGKRFDIYTYCRNVARKHGRDQADPYLRRKLEMVVTSRYDSVSSRRIFRAKQDHKILIQEAAEVEADEICAQYIEKNIAKLASIIEGRGDFAEMKVLGRSVNPGAMEGRLRLLFAGEAGFEARSQAVMSFSQNGTPFMRYPLTFHDVCLTDGSVMSRPSEKRMNEVFVADAAEISPGSL
ncbi:hypothetical protein [Pseudosulfitobacter pseudonitzschiae]|uniref:hypothetical protein n=1 Tax=Pseudosulfitobacter pseudonitzschiae TaxID=1402135 RepID=UPI003B7C34B3